jgi:hypothetical protein
MLNYTKNFLVENICREVSRLSSLDFSDKIDAIKRTDLFGVAAE